MQVVVFILCFIYYVVIVNLQAVHNENEEEWTSFKSKFNKSFESRVEDRIRKHIYLENKVLVAKHKELYRSGLSTFLLGMNSFSDMIPNELVYKMNGFKYRLVTSVRNYPYGDASKFSVSGQSNVPLSVDWRQKGYVTPVKNQGSCGSSWAFSATGSLEGQYFRKNGTLVSLSEQNLIDCSHMYGNDGCNGGMMDLAFKYVKANKGLNTEKSYPYENKRDECQYKPENDGIRVTGFVSISENENVLMHAVSTVGPVSVAIDASSIKFQLYEDGIYYDPTCSSYKLNHGVLIVGYGTDSKNGDYWIVKNSWGIHWGKDGYILMARNRRNHCGISTRASYPVV